MSAAAPHGPSEAVSCLQRAADALQENYTSTYAGAQDAHRSAQQMLDSLTKVASRIQP